MTNKSLHFSNHFLNRGYQYEWTSTNGTFSITSICFDPARNTFGMKDMITAILNIAVFVAGVVITRVDTITITIECIPLDAISMMIVN